MRWSAPAAEVAKLVHGRQAVSFWVEDRPRLRRVRVHFLLQPLTDVVALGGERDPLPDGSRDDWLVWQSHTAMACPTRLPTDGGRLAERLGAEAPGGEVVRAALQELMSAIYGIEAG